MLFLPVTSLPLLSERLGDATVAPLALVPAAILGLLWLLPYLRSSGKIPLESRPLILFVLIVLTSAAIGLVLTLQPFKDQTALARELRALVTLAAGIGVYLIVSLFPSNDRLLRAGLIALNVGAAFALAWAVVQAIPLILGEDRAPLVINQLHRAFSIRDIPNHRVTGLAFEPSWFGDQLVVLYLPLWLGSVLTRTSSFTKPGRMPWVELTLAAVGTAMLVMTRSRIAIASLLAMAGLIILLGFWRLGARGIRWKGRHLSIGRWPRLIGALLSIAVLISVVIIAARAIDPRMSRILTVYTEWSEIRAEHPYSFSYELANRVAFAERVVYWRAGWEGFRQYPVLGVGLGNAGFLFPENVPAYGARLPEIRQMMNPSNLNFPNPKNLWIRLLSETGFVGFAAFVTWWIVVFAAAAALRRIGKGNHRAMGLVGVLAMTSFALEGFSLDTFALPHTWIIPGLVTAAIAKVKLEQPALSSSTDAGPSHEP